VIVVGQAPGPSTDPAEPLSGASGRRLASLCGLDLPDFLARFERVNLLTTYPGRLGKGDAFPMAFAREAAAAMAERVTSRRITVMLGLNVARAFGMQRLTFFELTRLPHGYVVVAPHPSGVSHWWNDPSNVSLARLFWRALAEGLGP